MDAAADQGWSRAEGAALHLGRYRVVGQLGAGGMGTVFDAYDTRLERRVAIKVLGDEMGVGSKDSNRTSRARQRLRREAWALARLAHPNIVSIYDVGEAGGRLFLVMDRVRGRTVREWAAERPRSIAEILGVLVAVARGLDAAHRHGLLHRDVKPDNVLVAADGQVFVVDFGLVGNLDGLETVDPSRADSADLDAELESVTQAGDVLGTPNYMAPEQHLGASVDERSDVFGFFVMAHELLHGRRPFVGKTRHELVRAIAEGRRDRSERGLPRWLDRLIAQGLAARADERVASMAQALDEMTRVRVGLAQTLGLGLLGVAMIVASVLGFQHISHDPCGSVGRELESVWSTNRATRIRRRFAAKADHGESTFARVQPDLDRFVEQWGAARVEICREDRGLPVDRRLACLERAAGQLRTLLAQFESADRGIVDHAVSTVDILPAPDACGTSAANEPPWPADPRLWARVARVRTGLASSLVLLRAGRERQALTEIRGWIPEVLAIEHDGVRAELELQRGIAFLQLGSAGRAIEHLDRASRASIAGEHPRVAAEAELAGVFLRGFQLFDADASSSALRESEARVARLGDPAPLRSRLEAVRAVVRSQRGDRAGSCEAYEDAIDALRSEGHDDDPQLITLVGNLGFCRHLLGQTRAAVRINLAAVGLGVSILGPRHPSTSLAHMQAGFALLAAGDADAAADQGRSALRICQATDRTACSLQHWVLLQAAWAREDWFAGEEAIDAIAAIQDERKVRSHPLVAWASTLRAQQEVRRGRVDASVREWSSRGLQRALSDRSMTPATRALSLRVDALAQLGRDRSTPRLERAAEQLERAARILTGPSFYAVVERPRVDRARAQVALEQARYRSARDFAQRGLQAASVLYPKEHAILLEHRRMLTRALRALEASRSERVASDESESSRRGTVPANGELLE